MMITLFCHFTFWNFSINTFCTFFHFKTISKNVLYLVKNFSSFNINFLCCFKSWFLEIAITKLAFFSYYFVILSILCKILTNKTISLAFFTFWTMFCNGGNTFLTSLFNAFVVIEWFDLNSSSNSLFEILLIFELIF